MLTSFNASPYVQFLHWAPRKHQLLSRAVCRGLLQRCDDSALRKHPAFTDIGSGQGNLTIPVINAIAELAGRNSPASPPVKVQATMIEPDVTMLASLARRLAKQDDKRELDRIVEVYVRNTLESVSAVRMLPVASQFFVLASHVFYYLADWASSLADMRRLVAPGGWLCVVLKSMDTPFYQMRNALPWDQGTRSDVARPYFAEDFAAVLGEAGIVAETESIAYDFVIPGEGVHSLANPDSFHDLAAFWLGIDRRRWTPDVAAAVMAFFDSRRRVDNSVKLEYAERIFWVKS